MALTFRRLGSTLNAGPVARGGGENEAYERATGKVEKGFVKASTRAASRNCGGLPSTPDKGSGRSPFLFGQALHGAVGFAWRVAADV